MDTTALPMFSTALVGIAAFVAAGSLPGVWDDVTRRYIADLTPSIRALGIEEARIPTFLRWWGLALTGTFAVVGVVLGMWPLILPAMYLVYIAPRLWLKCLIRRRQIRIRDQLVGATAALANTARAGMSLAQGLESVCRETQPPLASELGRIVREYHGGLPLATALSNAKDRLQVDSFTLFASAVLTSLERGGRITEALDRISRSLQENQRVERKLEAETASGKKVVRILAAFPLFFLAVFFVIYPQGTTMLFTTRSGQIILAVVLVLVFLSVRWSNKILALDV